MIEAAIRSFVAADGRVPFQAWFDSLDRQTQARIAVALTRLSRGNRAHVKGVDRWTCQMLKLDSDPAIEFTLDRTVRRLSSYLPAAPRGGKAKTLRPPRHGGWNTRLAVIHRIIDDTYRWP